MVEDTYHVRATFLDTEPLPSVEASIAAAPAVEGAYLRHAPFLLIYNEVGSGKLVKIRRVALRTLSGQGQTTLLPTNLQLSRISAITVDGDTIVPDKMNTSIGDLPSQVKIQQYANTTETAGTELRRLLNLPEQNMVRALSLMCVPKFKTAEWTCGDYACQGVSGHILREGEGITIRNTTVPFSMAWRVFCLFTTSAGTYVVSEIMRSVDDQRNLFTIFNGSGSGVVINVRQLIVMEAGTDDVPAVAMYRVESYSNGDDVSAMAMDTSKSLYPFVKVKTKPEAVLYGASYGAIIVNPKYRRVQLNTWGTSPGLAGVDMKSQLDNALIIDNIGSVSAEPITLRAGEGIALIQAENASGLGLWAASVTFSLSDLPADLYSLGRVVSNA